VQVEEKASTRGMFIEKKQLLGPEVTREPSKISGNETLYLCTACRRIIWLDDNAAY